MTTAVKAASLAADQAQDDKYKFHHPSIHSRLHIKLTHTIKDSEVRSIIVAFVLHLPSGNHTTPLKIAFLQSMNINSRHFCLSFESSLMNRY